MLRTVRVVDRARAALWHGTERGFRTEDVDLPVPVGDEVLVRIRMATVCGSDLHTLRGDRSTPLPTVLGHEAVGVVVAAGPAATTHGGGPVVEGMRVTWTIGTSCGRCARCERGLPQKCDVRRKYGHEASTGDRVLNGGFASHDLFASLVPRCFPLEDVADAVVFAERGTAPRVAVRDAEVDVDVDVTAG